MYVGGPNRSLAGWGTERALLKTSTIPKTGISTFYRNNSFVTLKHGRCHYMKPYSVFIVSNKSYHHPRNAPALRRASRAWLVPRPPPWRTGAPACLMPASHASGGKCRCARGSAPRAAPAPTAATTCLPKQNVILTHCCLLLDYHRKSNSTSILLCLDIAFIQARQACLWLLHIIFLNITCSSI